MSTKIARKDKGRVLPTQDDYPLMRTIGIFDVLRMDDVCYELGKHRGKPVSPRTAQYVIDRLTKLHFVECQKFGYGDPPYIWATTLGLRYADLPYSFWKPQSIDKTYHPRGVYRMWRSIEENRNYSVEWFRTYRAMEHYEHEREHIPDIEAKLTYLPDNLTQVVAFEYERIQKSASRLDKIMDYLTSNYNTSFYFTEDEAWTAVEKAIARLPDERRDRVKMKSFSRM